jgi:hypothetical protein
MSANAATENESSKKNGSDGLASPLAMHAPGHCDLDTIETAALDEIQHEAALRESALRAPR